jgi:hypothetical protein
MASEQVTDSSELRSKYGIIRKRACARVNALGGSSETEALRLPRLGGRVEEFFLDDVVSHQGALDVPKD